MSYVIQFILLYVAVLVVSSIFQELKKYIEKRWDLVTDNKLSLYSMRKRAGIDIANYEDPEFQNLVYKAFDNGTWPIQTLAQGQIINIARVFGILAAGAIVYSINSTLLIVSLAASIPNFIIELKYGYNMWGIWAENSPRQRLYYALREHIQKRQHVVQTKMLQASNKLLSIIDGIMEAFLGEQLRVDKKRLWLGIASNIIMALGIGYGMYVIVGEVLAGNILAGTLVFAIFSLKDLVSNINGFLSDIANQYRRALTARDMFAVYDTPARILESKNAKHLDLAKTPHIEFKNVSFKYPSKNPENSPWVFKDLNFTMEPGEKIGIVGQNGAGKSTLIKLMMRIYDPTEGAILIDGIDLKEIVMEEWTSVLSVLLQQYSLHEFDVEGAIAMGLPNKEISPEDAMRAAKLSGADEFIQEYPKGYKQQISREFEDGIEPSQGQLQKIALARALYRLQGGQILILDEPTAAIDPLAELEIFEQMEKATKDKTLILITHRFNSVKNVDKILVLNGHTLAEQGSHEELMRERGIYASMFEGQAKGFREDSSDRSVTVDSAV
jgi:ATP-binding cassette subfamily B protein